MFALQLARVLPSTTIVSSGQGTREVRTLDPTAYAEFFDLLVVQVRLKEIVGVKKIDGSRTIQETFNAAIAAHNNI